MALTVVSKPKGLQPVAGGSMIYQFTEASIVGKPNYRVEIEFNGLGLPKFEFRPDASLTINADLAPILASVLKLTAVTSDRFKNTYVKYQAVWTGGSDAQVPLTTDIIYFYAGNNHYLNFRTPLQYGVRSADGSVVFTNANGRGLVPTPNPNEKMKVWTKSMIFEFLHDDTLPANLTVVLDYGGGTLTSALNFGNQYRMEQINFGLSNPTVIANYNNNNSPHIRVVDTATGLTCYLYIPIVILEPGDNSIFLRWINDYGGLSYYNFDYNQDLSIPPDSDNKYLVKTLYEKNCNLTEWMQLNEINREGLVYNDSKRIGQFLQDATVQGTFTDVIVVKDTPKTRTNKIGHQFNLTIRYGAIPNSSVTG